MNRARHKRPMIGATDSPPPGDKAKKLLDDISDFVRVHKLSIIIGGVAFLYVKNIGDSIEK